MPLCSNFGDTTQRFAGHNPQEGVSYGGSNWNATEDALEKAQYPLPFPLAITPRQLHHCVRGAACSAASGHE